jgi:26S proteasome regulatory subunit N5
MADNKKQERDFTVEVDAILPAAESLAKVCLSLSAPDTWPLTVAQSGQLQDALDKIFVLEKQTRNVRFFFSGIFKTEFAIL